MLLGSELQDFNRIMRNWQYAVDLGGEPVGTSVPTRLLLFASWWWGVTCLAVHFVHGIKHTILTSEGKSYLW